MKKFMLFLTLAILFFAACVKEKSPTPAATVAEDNMLNLEQFTGNVTLPESDDYASIPQDSLNPLTAEKVALGKLLFHETRLAGNPRLPDGINTYSCATCHHAEAGFQSGLAQAIGEGGSGFGLYGEVRVPSALYIQDSVDVQPIRTPSVLNIAYQDVMAWNGGFGSGSVNTGTEYAWTGNLLPLNFLGYKGPETISMSAQKKHRFYIDTAWLVSDTIYKPLFDLAFPDIPEDQRVCQTTVGLAIAAYERTMLANQSPYQRWLKGDRSAMTADEKAGRKLFFGKANCSSCHKGPALNSNTFYALGMADMQNGINGCINISSDATENKGRGGFTNKSKDMYKFKVPQLYNLKDARYLGHGGTFNSVEEVVRYINNAVPENPKVPAKQIAKQFVPLNLTEEEIAQLVKFVEDGLYDPNLSRYVPASVPSGNCIPNNDAQSRAEKGLY